LAKNNFNKLINYYADDYLICDASYPLITNANLNEELLLYNIENHKRASLLLDFYDITGRQLRLDSDIGAISGGQKVVLMVLFALYSPAEKILLFNLPHSLDLARQKAVNMIIDKFKPAKQDIKVMNDAVDS
jgi:hypothetical protein